MSNPTSPGRPARCRITVRRLAPTHGITTRQLIQAVDAALGGHEYLAISVVIVDDAGISDLHQRYLNDPTPTDVLAFDLRDDPADGRIEGEIVVSAETAARQAGRFRSSPDQELLRYAVHGTLHLVGYDDHTPAGRLRMRRAENRILAGLTRATNGKRHRRAIESRSHKKPGRTTGSVWR
jgi:probable rRNA maturation factor